jgi:hypothetical protein
VRDNGEYSLKVMSLCKPVASTAPAAITVRAYTATAHVATIAQRIITPHRLKRGTGC